MKARYEKLLEKAAAELVVLEKKSRWLGYTKLILVAGLLVSLWFAYRNDFAWQLGLLCGLLFIVCVGFWVWHGRVCNQISYWQGHSEIVRRYVARIDGSWGGIKEDGAEFINPAHPYTGDLDIFGPQSLFQYLNIAHTYYGKKQFRQDLENANYTQNPITQRQQAIAELAGKQPFAFEFEYHSAQVKDNQDLPQLLQDLEGMPPFIRAGWFGTLVRWLPLALLAAVVVIFVLGVKMLYIPALVMVGVLLAGWLLSAIKAGNYLAIVQRARYGLGQYSELFTLVEQQKFQCEHLDGLQQVMLGENHSAAVAVKELDKILQRVEVRRNFLAYVILNASLWWDANSALRLQMWVGKYSRYLTGWFNALGAMESLLCFSIHPNIDPTVGYPASSGKHNVLQAENIGHPLIPLEQRVCNNFSLHNQINIISGSNMSGKTTFLRTIAMNLLLAKCGAAVCATSMVFSGMEIITSMRIADDLHSGLSTFYAELTKIKAILTLAEERENVIFFIDEIFRGTNSDDRVGGARVVVRQLAAAGACGFLTTHDLSLCSLEEQNNIENWHFSEQLQEEALSFDYKIKPGVAQTTNGRYLMRLMGILPQAQ